MTGADKAFVGGMPAIYEKLFVPMIFEPYAREMAERIAKAAPRDVLEIAAGTGVLTRAMASRLGPETRIVATDLNQPMLDRAIASQGADARVTFKQADGLALPFGDQVFDIVTCQFGVMFFPDKIAGYREARRVLRPTGRYLFNVWDRLENNAFVLTAARALTEMFPADPPRFMERTPHGYHDLSAITADARAAGFSSVQTETIVEVSRAKSALEAATAYCQGNPLAAEIEARAPGKLQDVTETVAAALRRQFGDGAIEGSIRAHIITASP
ncbi:class I SAM-dependent methyltransferase [Rhizobium sp. PL01]|uniref:class I SAM-dependent methyltransferase n=1 Tax=Rhizobium sp. PL01 TaxID=3085631 RepID=UPI0029822803|nr:methyltransferase domain-containing protein [Rhizobium sp. PL01]MDW5315543.1 methyltransferase domain-containing protein [Rhizobium sp. PL01]